LSENEFYLQLSISEGFPNSLCEAMLCECIPIGSNVGGIPQIIGNSGRIIGNRDITLIKHEILHLSGMEEDGRELLGENARKRIIENFSIEKREASFWKLIGDN
jgi:glycosyltransferase involved in cell wall biosynthesis